MGVYTIQRIHKYSSIMGSALPPGVYELKHHIEIACYDDIVTNSMIPSYIRVSYLRGHHYIDKSLIDCTMTSLHAYPQILSYACIVNEIEYTVIVSTDN